MGFGAHDLGSPLASKHICSSAKCGNHLSIGASGSHCFVR
jgi:hypothetical protein